MVVTTMRRFEECTQFFTQTGKKSLVHAAQISYRIENRRRDRLYGKPVADATVDTGDLADKVCEQI